MERDTSARCSKCGQSLEVNDSLDEVIEAIVRRAASDIMSGYELNAITHHRAKAVMQRLARRVRAAVTAHLAAPVGR